MDKGMEMENRLQENFGSDDKWQDTNKAKQTRSSVDVYGGEGMI